MTGSSLISVQSAAKRYPPML